MKTVSLTYSQKELQYCIFAAVVEGLCAADLTGRGYFITMGSDDSNYSIELWASATKSENGDGRKLHSVYVNKGDYQMNDVRLGVVLKYVAEHARQFVDQITGIINEPRTSGPITVSSDSDLVSFGNYLLRKVNAKAHTTDGAPYGPREVTHADLANWRGQPYPMESTIQKA